MAPAVENAPAVEKLSVCLLKWHCLSLFIHTGEQQNPTVRVSLLDFIMVLPIGGFVTIWSLELYGVY